MEMLLGFLLPPVVEAVNKDIQNEPERFIIAYVVCILLACGIDWQAIANAHLVNLLYTISIIAAESNVMFVLYWKNSLVRVKLQTALKTANAPTTTQ